jgi:hypothetical protein
LYGILLLFGVFSVSGYAQSSDNHVVVSSLEDGIPKSEWFYQAFTSEERLFDVIREALVKGSEIDKLPTTSIPFDPSISYVSVTLFHEGQKPIRWISRRGTLLKTLNRIVYKLREHPRFKRFEVSDPDKCRIMLEVITKEHSLEIKNISPTSVDSNRFEPGITGFRLRYKGQSHFYMPTDAVVNSHLSIRHVLNHITKRIGIAKETNKISKRIEKLLSRDIEWFSIYSVSFVTDGDKVIPLYRGYPYPMNFSPDSIKNK